MGTRRRAIGIGCSLIAHTVMVWAVMPHVSKPQIEAAVMSVSLFDGEAVSDVPPARPIATPQPDRPPEAVVVPPEIEPLPAADVLPPVDATAEPEEIGEAVSTQVAASATAAMFASEGDRCAVGEWLTAALQADPQVREALDAVPASARSVANAVMLWNGQWATPPANASRGMTAIRALVVAGVTAAPLACQTQAITGPVLITLGDASKPTALAIGSGQWRWRDLLQISQQLQ